MTIINVEKTKVLEAGGHLEADQIPISLRGRASEDVKSFSYLGSAVEQSGKVDKEMAVRTENAGTMYQIWRREVFRSQNLNKATKM